MELLVIHTVLRYNRKGLIKMNERYLPIGSIVKLKNSNKKIMITGYFSVEYKNDIVVYDYSGCAYPEGMMLKSNYCSFNHGDIETVEFTGYKDDSYIAFNKNLSDADSEMLFDEIDENKKIEEKEDVEPLISFEFDSLEEPEKEKPKEDEFKIPHYEFDENGIIIK